MDSLDLTEHPRRDPMTLSRDSGLTLSDCQLFLPESPVGSEDSAVNTSSSTFDKSLVKEEKSTNKAYIRVYGGWEERMNGSYASGSHHTNGMEQQAFREEKTANASCHPNPNFQRQDWIRAQLKRMPRTKPDEHEQRKERFDDKDIYVRGYIRQDSMKENVENCKDLYRNSQQQQDIRGGSIERCQIHSSQQQNIRGGNERCSTRSTEQDHGANSAPLSDDHYEFKKKDCCIEIKKFKCDYANVRESPVSQIGKYAYAKKKSDLYLNNKEPVRSDDERYNDSDGNIYGSPDRSNELYGSNEIHNAYSSCFPSETIELSFYQCNGDKEEEKKESGWSTSSSTFETPPPPPPPLPPRLRHLPPVHMNLEDRHKVAGRSRSLPPPPPYRPPPQPRAPITTRHLGYGRSVVDDESYV